MPFSNTNAPPVSPPAMFLMAWASPPTVCPIAASRSVSKSFFVFSSTRSSRFSVYSLSFALKVIFSLALFRAISRASSFIGFVIKSVASNFKLRMASSISPCPVIMMTSVSGLSSLIVLSTCMPSIPGIFISVNTMGGAVFLKSLSASSPFSADRTS